MNTKDEGDRKAKPQKSERVEERKPTQDGADSKPTRAGRPEDRTESITKPTRR